MSRRRDGGLDEGTEVREDDAVIVCPNFQCSKTTLKQASELTGLPIEDLERRILPATPGAILNRTTPKQPFLLEDVDDFHPQDRQAIQQQRKILALYGEEENAYAHSD